MDHNAYALKHKEIDVLLNSSSGGAFTAISDYVLDQGGFVFGAIYDYSNNCVKHVGTNELEIRNLMRGSKYIQSRIGNCFLQVRELLRADRMVLFTGTICQIAGLQSYLRATNTRVDSLICCDIICHGTASPRIWLEYIESKIAEHKTNSISDINFRNKEKGWSSSYTTCFMSGNKVELPEFMKLFYSHTIMRDSCYVCPFANLNRISDITIGDFWGIEKSIPEMDPEYGVSYVMTNSIMGLRLINNLKRTNEVLLRECRIEDVIQPNFYHPTKKSVIKECVWNEYKKHGIKYIIIEYTSDRKLMRARIFLKKIIYVLKEKMSLA